MTFRKTRRLKAVALFKVVLAALAVLMLSLVASTAPVGAVQQAAPAHKVVPHGAPSYSSTPTCGTSSIGPGFLTLKVCIQASSAGLSFTWSGYNPSTNGEVAEFSNKNSPTCSGGICTPTYQPAYSWYGSSSPSELYALPYGEYAGFATLTTGASPEPEIYFDLTVGPPAPAFVGITPTPDGKGYWLVRNDGVVQAFGDATWYGDLTSVTLNKPIVGIAATQDGKGYWLDATDGGIFAFGDAGYYGSMGGQPLNLPMVGMAATQDGKGYWTVAADGGIFSFGDAAFHGSTGSLKLNKPVVGMAVDHEQGSSGYWLVATDGGIFAFGAPFFGSTGSLALNQPINEMEATADGGGYRFVASDGGVFSFGNASFAGSLGGQGVSDIVGMAPYGVAGYWLLGADGTVYPFGGATNYGNGS